MSLLHRDRAALVVVDVQEGFRPAIDGFDSVVAQTVKLVRGVRELGIPVIATEQYPKGLGATVPEIGERALGRMEKAGAVVTTTEAALFECLERAGSPEFTFVQGLVK